MRELRDVRRLLQQVMAANPLATAGISAVPDGIIVQGSETVNGPLTINGASVFNGNSDINGSMFINGPLHLQPGSIENDALTSPLSAQTAHADVSDFALNTGANAEMVRATVAVPAGYTKALVMASASLGNRNPNAFVDDMYVDCRINGAVSGWSSQTSVIAGKVGFVVNVGAALVTGLSGSFYIAANASSGTTPWAANGAAAINVDAIVLFLR